ncbi:hypothetical protein CAEBREN_09338 [Caenorhabditis brenneri]|uniref:F-box domain-containing protein n=1 Tax=Caenorhabditis brenneri TaxID=135651 RepID=G0NNW7_CAEBE|nr:hypothetical protein CAEBREN_09338 [Caenorhabditis brenneri]
MKFHRFPHLVQREICSLLHPFDLVLLSFCSDRTRRAVKKANKNRKHEIWVSGIKWYMSYSFREMNNFKRSFSVYWNGPQVCRSKFYIKIDGTDVGICERFRQGEIYLEDCSHSLSMHKYICNLFNVPEEIYVKSNQLECELQSVKRSYLWNSDSEFTLDDLERFYRYHPDQEFSEVSGKLALGYDHYNENVFVVRNLISRGTIRSIWRSFKLFKGENAYCEDTYMSLFQIKYAMEEWMKRKDDGLKSMIFKPKEEYDVEKTRKKVKEISCGNERKQEVYPYKSM